MKIHSYAAEGDCNGVRDELRKGFPIDARDEQDYTPLAHAVSSTNADEKMVRLLIESGADVNAAVDSSKKFPIGLAACAGSLSKVQLLLDAGANVNFVSPNGYTALINVIYSLHDHEMLVRVAEFLVRNGAEMNSQSSYGESPLSVASRRGRFDAVKFLLDAGADPSPLKWTELMRATALGGCEEVERLLDGTSGLGDRDSFDRTPWLLTALVGEMRKAKLLHSIGANLDERGRGGDTALMYCAARGNAEMLQWLIEIGANVEAVDDNGNTALMLAAQAGATTCVQLLLEARAGSSRKNKYDESAMAMASIPSSAFTMMSSFTSDRELSR